MIKMVKIVMSDFASRKLVFEKGNRFRTVFWIMMSVLWIFTGVLNHGVEETGLFLVLFLPLGLLTFFHEIYPTALSPAMYLVPLNEAEKLEYLRCCYMVKLFGTNMLFFVVNLTMVLWGKILWWYGIGMVVSFFLLSFPMGTPNNKKRISYEIKLWDYKNSEWNKWQDILYLLGGIFSYSFWLIIACGEWEEWMYIGIVLSFLIQVLMLPWMIRNIKRKFAEAVFSK